MKNEEIKNIDDMELSDQQLDQVAGGTAKKTSGHTATKTEDTSITDVKSPSPTTTTTTTTTTTATKTTASTDGAAAKKTAG